jgi:magnesium-protoporphyrin O-methyltransferase
MPGCCSAFGSAADQQFNQRKVAQELKRYREKGPGPTTRLLADGIAQSGALSGTVLDVGSGIGALTLALLERGASNAIAVDASTAYVAVAREEAGRRGQTDAIQFVHADFVERAPHLPSANVVALDRVVCCYPSWEHLLDAALGHAERCLALSYPRDAWYVRLGMTLENGQRWIARNSFRTFVHPISKIEQAIRRAGFGLSNRRETWMWSVDVYLRRSNSQ